MKIQLRFHDPWYISPVSEQDYIVVHFKDRSPFFISFDGDGIVGPDYLTLRRRIRP